ncbi:LacI family DNA-binding transcriptional regulator [Novosphingobium sp. MBES04]|uniref:LacI family DNA-binding transcriptional regulator n=1 Tax=Novosphingobium sp. MBES04 TaxID=1206458 RepID=UPI000694AD8E|nr:LacI family DNA-binding transcriptional regulator [Novosphingobium sp. MBES04]GAM04113.1 LacI family transcriptional regulator [Novosphingobium sp. MBES04]
MAMADDIATSSSQDRAPTLDDVAALAGVSAATVSRFFSNPKIVAKATGERIRAAVSDTGYIPNALAGGLASKRSRMVAVLIPHLTDSIFNDTIELMTEELTASGSNVMLGLTGVSVMRTHDLIRGALARRVDAIISTGPLNAESIALVTRSRTLFIQVWELPEAPVGTAIGFSHSDAGRDMARFLASRGYRRPFLVTADGARARLRRDSFVQEWNALGGEAPQETLVDIPSRFGHARRAFAEMRRLSLRPDVVVCGSDYLAQGILIEAQHAGLSVPEDLAVMGFGNSLLAGEMRPTITTVDVDGSRIAREVLAVLRKHGEDPTFEHQSVDVGFRIIARESA